jgi:hypothetical protein
MKSKFGNKITYVDDIRFDSKSEANYYLYLKQLQESGVISNLQLQVPYEIIPAVYVDEVKHLKTKDKTVKRCVQKATNYYADFVYVITATGEKEVVDVKGKTAPLTKEFRLKQKLMLYRHGIPIKIVRM